MGAAFVNSPPKGSARQNSPRPVVVEAVPERTGPFVAPTDTTSIAQDGNEDEASSQPNDPHVGMRYDTLEGAKEHYNAHAARKGFSVKVNVGPIPDSMSKDEADIENAELASIVADLAAQGRKEKAPKKRKRENIVHTFCRAQMVVKLIDGRWEVIHFVPEHNHPLIHKPSLTKYLRSHQGMPKEEKEFVKNLHNTNLTAGKMMEIMSEFYGSELLVPYTTKTITNYCATLTREETKDGDLAEVASYFVELKEEKDPDFYFRLKLDDEDRQELATSYDWLFESFLIAMNGLAPDNIITDQDGAMAVSIGRLLPSSVHRNCRWHIMQNTHLKCGPTLGGNPGLAEDFNYCIDFSFSPEEFEAKWALFVGKFFPFLQSTQRSEGFNAILKRYTNPKNSILHFVKQYEKLQSHVLVKEGGNDYMTDCLELRPWSPFPVEEHAFKVYCRDIYLRFRNEFELIGRYNVLPFGCNFYKLEPNRGWCAKYGTRTYLVTANKEEGTYYRECSKMDRDGILCCHILKIFTHLGVDEIPESRTDAATAIVYKQLRAAATEISHLNKSLKKKNPVSAVPSTSAPDQPTKSRDPAKTTTKGRTKVHRTVSALQLHPKKKVQCQTCGSFEHNSATCKLRFL
ncbi:protein FAR1-RELATED SEQUENCE 5-like [Lolium perenne]|uniref:protein FAR1-RELATED SEQUENCE 5-like n=1 Tax=Lolium perenne TaxID=4522 RepID=UPI003A9A5698